MKLFVYTADEPSVGKRGPFWNTCTRAHCNLVTPLGTSTTRNRNWLSWRS